VQASLPRALTVLLTAQALAGAVKVVGEGGKIFLGDVRSLPLWEVFAATVQLERAGEGERLGQLRQRMAIEGIDVGHESGSFPGCPRAFRRIGARQASLYEHAG